MCHFVISKAMIIQEIFPVICLCLYSLSLTFHSDSQQTLEIFFDKTLRILSMHQYFFQSFLFKSFSPIFLSIRSWILFIMFFRCKQLDHYIYPPITQDNSQHINIIGNTMIESEPIDAQKVDSLCLGFKKIASERCKRLIIGKQGFRRNPETSFEIKILSEKDSSKSRVMRAV